MPIIPLRDDEQTDGRAEDGQSMGSCPWKGLDPYLSADGALFVGRERVLRQLRLVMEASSLAGVVGASGSGKSSLLAAGLSQTSASLAMLRPGANPLQQLRETVASLTVGMIDGTTPTLVVDQLEEVFTVCDDEAGRAAFLDELYAIAESGRARVVVALRSDHYGSCAPYRNFADALSRSHVLLGAPSEEELRRIITVPAAASGVTIERGLDDDIIDDVVGESGALPLLSFALAEAWLRREGDAITRVAYRQAGGVRGAIARTAEELWKSLPIGQQRAAKAILIRLAVRGSASVDAARRVPTTELTPSGDIDGDAALQSLVNARLVTVDNGTAEITHEAVFREWPRLRSWLDEDRDAYRLLASVREAAKTWREHNDETTLYRGVRLQAVLDVVARPTTPPLDEVSRAFVQSSVEATARDDRERSAQVAKERQANRRLRSLLSGALALLLFAGVAFVFAARQTSKADTERRRADARRLAAVAAGVLDDRLDLAALLSVEAHRRQNDLETQGALFTTLTDQPGLRSYIHVSDAIVDVAISPSGRWAAVPSDDFGVDIWNVEGKEPIKVRRISLGADRAAYRLAFTDDTHMLIGDSVGGVRMVNVETGASMMQTPDQGGGVWAVALNPDASIVASAGEDALVHLSDAATGLDKHAPLQAHENVIQLLKFSPDGTVLASGGSDGTLRFWDTRTWAPQRSPIVVEQELWALEWLPNGAGFVVATGDSVQFFDARGTPDGPPIRAHDGATYRLQLIDDGATLVSSGEDGYVRFWDTKTHQEARPALRGHPAGVRMAIAEPVQRMVTSSDDGSVGLWDLRGVSAIATPISEKTDGRTQVVTTPDGRVFTGDRAGNLRQWDALGRPHGLVVHVSDAPIVSVSISSNGDRVAVGMGDGKAQLLELPSGRPLSPRLDVGRADAVVALSPNGQRLATVNSDHDCSSCVVLYDLTGTTAVRPPRPGRELTSPSLTGGLRSPATSAVFDPTGTRLATGIRLGWVDVWNTESGAHLWASGLPRGVRSLAYSPDGRRLAVGANAGLLAVLDGQTGARVQQLQGHRGPVVGVAFSPDSRLLASNSSQDHSLRIWRLDLGLTVGRPAWLGVDGVVSLGWTDHGRKVATAHLRTGVMLFDIDPGRMGDAACSLARRNLSGDEWRQYFGSRPYRRTCPAYPVGPAPTSSP